MANRPLVFDKPTAPGEEVQRAIVLTATNTCVRQAYVIPLARVQYWHANFADYTSVIDQAKQYYVIDNGKLTYTEMESIRLAIYKCVCFMSTLPNYTEYERE